MRNLEKGRDAATMIKTFLDAGGKWDEAAPMLKRQMPWAFKGDIGGTAQDDLAGVFGEDSNEYNAVAAGEFLAYQQNRPGIFDTLAAAGRKAGLRTRLFISDAPLTATITAEGIAIPVSKFAVDPTGLTPVKAAGLAVISNEALATPLGAAGLTEELAQAVTLAVDTELCRILIAEAGATETASDDAPADIKGVLDLVSTTGYERHLIFCGPYPANNLCSMRAGTDGNLLYPDMSPTGGIIHGIQVLVTPALDDTLILVDASAIVTASVDMEIKLSNQAAIEMNTAPAMDSTSPAAATGKVVSMFQAEATAIMGIRTFAAKVLRSSGVAVLETVAWGEGS